MADRDLLDVLVIAPHPDDAEIGMAGTILRLQEEGKRVGVLDLTSGEPTPYGDEETRVRETEAASEVLGLKWRENLALPNRSLEATLAARSLLANIMRRTRPSWIFAPFWTDAHPDHLAALDLIEASRFWSKLTKSSLEGSPHHPNRIFHYYSVHLRLAIQPDFIVDISPYIQRKLDSLRCYHSQFIRGREHEVPPILARVETHAAYWGHCIGRAFGEPFSCREPIGLSGLQGLV